jgi:glycerol-3-phosphate dehydrogenase
MTRIGVAYGANPLTFLSLAGVGDLFLTCSSSTSRNYTVGFRLGRGERLEEVLQTLGSVAEGVTTAKGLKAIVDELEVPAPLASAVSCNLHVSERRWVDQMGVCQVYEVLYEG